MAEAILDLRLDTVQPNRVRLVYGVQNDYNSRYICARFTANGKPIDIEKTAAVRINAKRPDGNKDAFPGTVNTDGTAKVPVAQWMLDVPGEVIASITAVTTGGALTTQEFYIMAKASIWDSTGEPSAENPDKDVLQTIIASENERVAAESTRVANENARKSAETARATAETKRIADEAERVANEAGRVSAEEIRREEFATWQDEWGKISSFDKRIENLEAAVSPGMVTPTIDDTIAYRKTVPNGVLPNAAVCEVGGMSYKCENLLNPNGFAKSSVTVVENSDGSYTITNITAIATSVSQNVAKKLPAGTYTIKNDSTKHLYIMTSSSDYSNSVVNGSQKTFTYDGTSYLDLLFADFKANETAVVKIMLNAGSTALPYQPYFTGLRDSKVTAVESVGANVYCGTKVAEHSTGGITYKWDSAQQIITISANTSAAAEVFLPLEEALNIVGGEAYSISAVKLADTSTVPLAIGVCDSRKKYNTSGGYNSLGPISTSKTYTFANDACVDMIHIFVNGSGTVNAKFKYMINKGSTALPYSPYFRESLTIPADALDGFGQGVNAQLYNKIVLDPLEGVKKYVNKAKTVVLDGATNKVWYVGETNGKYYASFTPSVAATSGTNFVSSHFTKKWADELGNIYIDNWGNFTMFNTDQSLTSVAKWNEWLQSNNITICYELATPTETDVSHLFTDDNLLPVEAGGTITAVNEYEQAVPFTIEYTVKGA